MGMEDFSLALLLTASVSHHFVGYLGMNSLESKSRFARGSPVGFYEIGFTIRKIRFRWIFTEEEPMVASQSS
jgi:hypothetical protein